MIQVRYTTPKNNVLHVKLANSWADKKGNHTKTRKVGDWDVLAVFNPDNKQVYFVDDKDFDNVRSITLRLFKSKNNQNKGVRLANEYKRL